MKRQTKSAPVDRLSIEEHTAAILGPSVLLRFTVRRILAETQSGALEDYIHGQVDQSNITGQIDRHCRAIVELDMAQGAR
jgi:hypothetical protein